ncbi:MULTISPECIES: hypothetical protein [unclassified Yoonia]|uniref:hypothetical protein n=1 Tax=unclassified Yoonia TaxID=2629118 RepID=UPI002AFE4D52|nr:MULTISPECIES: hypothetical protein [unclassified Yoonia]
MIRRTLATAAAIMICSVALADTPFEEVYLPLKADPATWDCQNIGFEGGAVAIEGNWLIDVENACELTNPTDVRGMNAILYDGQCAAEGEEYVERIMLMEQAHGGVFVIRDASVDLWKPCR